MTKGERMRGREGERERDIKVERHKNLWNLGQGLLGCDGS